MPTIAMMLWAPIGFLIAPLLGFPPNLREMIAASDGVTYWASDQEGAARARLPPRARSSRGCRKRSLAQPVRTGRAAIKPSGGFAENRRL